MRPRALLVVVAIGCSGSDKDPTAPADAAADTDTDTDTDTQTDTDTDTDIDTDTAAAVDCGEVEAIVEAASVAAASVGSSAWWLFASADDLAQLDSDEVATECGLMRRRVVDTVAHPEAVCNDGTPAVYYHQVGATDPDRWVVYLKGGSGCFSEAACRDRWTGGRFNDLMTSSESFWGPVAQSMLSGLLSDDPVDNPDLAGWSKVWMLYCSSDGWSGSQAGTGSDKDLAQTWEQKIGLDGGGGDAEIAAMHDDGTWHFRGRAIVDAVFAELHDPARFPAGTLDDASQVVFAGSSAGASGVRSHVDRLAAQLDPAVEVAALHDAGWFPPAINPDPVAVSDGLVQAGYDPTLVDAWAAQAGPDTQQRLVDIGVDPTWLGALSVPGAPPAWEMYAGSLRYGVDYVGAADNLDADCIAATDGSTGALPATERWLCLEPYVAHAFIGTPLFVYQDQHDPTDMGRVLLDASDPAHQASFATGVAALVPTAAGCFSTRLCTHEAAHDREIWTGGDVTDCDGAAASTQLDGRAYRDAFTDWLFDRGGDPCSVQP